MFDEQTLREEIHVLTASQGVAFVASCCERLLPMYQAFHKIEDWGDYNKLRFCLDEVWDFLKNKEEKEERLSKLIAECEELIPDSEEFDGLYAEGAQNAAIAVLHTLQYCIKGEIELTVNVARLGYEAIQAYIYIATDPNLDYHADDQVLRSWIQESPLLIKEVDKQIQDIAQLKSVTEFDEDFINNLKKSSDLIGINPFRRGLVKY